MMYSSRYSLATSHFVLTLLLSSTLLLPVDGVFKLVDKNAKLVHKPLDDVVYVFQFPRTSTTPSQAAYNLMVETWLHWKQIPFHRISNEVFMGSHSKGTAPFAYFNGKYIDGSVEIIKTVGQHFNKYQKAEGEDELMQNILEMFNILMVDRAAGLEWMVKDEGLIETMVPQLVNGRPNVQLQDGNYSIDVNAEFWKQYFDAFNAEAKTAGPEFVKTFLKKTNETNQKTEPKSDEQRWDDFNTWLRANVITRTMETMLMEEVDGKPNSVNPGNSQSKLKKFLEKNSLTDLNGKTKPYSEYSEAEISKELKDRWNLMTELVEKNQNALLHQEEQTMPHAALFGVLMQYFETPLNLAEFSAFSVKSGALFEFTQNVKRSLGLDDQKWEELTKRPWLLNFDTAFLSTNPTYNGPYKLEAVDLDQQTLSDCLFYENQIVSFSDNCTGVPNEIVMASKALMRIANAADKKLDHYYLARTLLTVMASYVCQVGNETITKGDCTDKHMQYVMKMYKEELKVDDKLIKLGIEEARKTVFEAINAYNDAKTGEAVRAAVLQVRAVVNNGGEAAKAVVSSTDLTNEY
uniref:Peptidase_M13_N domain-containing protein n=1 Tax=Globodera pallida TaxID=36090 RepID=A0A183BY66_GLOPA